MTGDFAEQRILCGCDRVRLALFYQPEAFSFVGKIMGRQSAGVGFLRALADVRPERICVHSPSRKVAADCAQALLNFGSKTGVWHIPLSQPAKLANAGLLYRPDPDIVPDSWRRLRHASPNAYSVCGITHTVNSHAALEAITRTVSAPLMSWDALICTSTTAKAVVATVLERNREHLKEWCGATRWSQLQLPVIPLGVHTADFAPNLDQRSEARARLGIAPHEVAILFAGRLVFHGKANPIPMWLGLEDAGAGRSVVLIHAGVAPTDAIKGVFATESKTLAPSIKHVFVDGNRQADFAAAWRAADIFTSLADNFQETFGLTPIEAMAAGLPVVVSDWNGYKDTVRHGVDGFRVATVTLPPGAGDDLADRYDLGLDDFDFHCAHTSQMVAVDVDQAAGAYRALIQSADLRMTMGEAGRRRARAVYDWSVVFQQYLELWEDLRDRRAAEVSSPASFEPRRRPDRPDPFTAFAAYPTASVSDRSLLRRRQPASVADALARRDLETCKHSIATLPTAHEVTQIVEAVAADGWTTVDALRTKLDERGDRFARTIIWLVKVGVLAVQLDNFA